MFKFRIVLVLLVIQGIFHGYSQDDDCEKIKVSVDLVELNDDIIDHLNEKYGVKTKQDWLKDIDDKVVEVLKTNSPELDFFSRLTEPQKDAHYTFTYALSLNVIETDLILPSYANTYEDPITGWKVTEYSDPVFDRETAFRFGGSLVINSPCDPSLNYIVAIGFGTAIELDMAINELSRDLWRIKNLIEASEEKRPVPARGPAIEIEYEKDYLSLLEKEDREMEVRVKVKNCEGEYLYRKVGGQPVYFPKKLNRCKYVQVKLTGCHFLGSHGDSEIVTTNKEYKAIGKYRVIEGLEPSKEKVNLGSCGIGSSSEIYKKGELIIRGLEIEVKPDRRELKPDERTKIVITFNETDPDGSKYPIKGKDIDVKIRGLENGTLKAENGYTTDSDGQVVLNYKAGSNDERILVTASYQPEDYPDKAEDQGSVIVKPPEYEAKLTIRKTYDKTLNSDQQDSKSEERYMRILNENIEASATIYLKLTDVADMPLFNQTWEYYKPVSVNVTSFNYNYKENRTRSGPKYETTVDFTRIVNNHEIKNKSSATQVPWILAIDNDTGKAVKIVPGGYSIDYEYKETEVMNSVIYSDDGPDRDSKTTTKTRERKFELGPVGEEIPDPTIKQSDTWIKDYIKDQGIELPPGVTIPEVSNTETIKEIPPDIVVSTGDGKHTMGGSGSRRIPKKLDFGFQEENMSYTWNMTRTEKNK
jgi:hypothetical protein